MGFFRFMSSSAGRWLRGLAGLVLFLLGLLLGGWWLIMAAVGFVVMAAGMLDFCIFAPLAGKPFMGPKLREALK